MKPFAKGILLAVLHIAILSSLAGKLLYDRATRPRVWVKTAPFDPNLPIRGRYVQLQLEVRAPNVPVAPKDRSISEPVKLRVFANELIAEPDPRPVSSGQRLLRRTRGEEAAALLLMPPVAFFISEHAQDPSVRPQGETLWVEVTVPETARPDLFASESRKAKAPLCRTN